MGQLANKIATFSFLVGLVTYTFAPTTLGKVRIEGEVLQAYPDYFLLTNEEGLTLVEMNNVESYDDSISLIPGDEVVVKGTENNNSYSEDSVEAQSVLVKNLKTLYLLTPTVEEDVGDVYSVFKNNDDSREASSKVVVRGVITQINKNLISLELDSGEVVKVNLANLNCRNDKNEDVVQIKSGDEISIMGLQKKNLLGADQIDASNLLIYKY